MTDPRPMPPVSSYELAASHRADRAMLESRIQRDGTTLWAITSTSGGCLTEPGTWEFEPMPSSRDDAYLGRARRSLDDALSLWELHLVAAGSGGSWGGALVGSSRPEVCVRVYDPGQLLPLLADPAEAPRHGSWITPGNAEATRENDDDTDVRELAVELDMLFRRTLGLHALDLFRQGCVSAVIAERNGFVAEAATALDEVFESELLNALAVDLFAVLADGREFPIGLATLHMVDDAVVARIPDRRPGIDFSVAS